MILTLVGVSDGMLGQIAERSKGTGADILVRPSGGSILSMTGSMPEKIVDLVRAEPHVALATGTLVRSYSFLDSITGIHLDEFNRMSGGLKYISGGPFTGPDDVMVDDVYATSKKLHAGDMVELGGLKWRICAVVGQGKLSRMFAPIESLQEKYSSKGLVSVIYVKADDPKNMDTVIAELKMKLGDYPVFSMEEFTSLISVDSIPIVKQFTVVVIGLGVIVGFLVVFLSMYMAVLERTREIGILKALGASPGYIMSILLREAVLLAIVGTLAGILMTYGTRSLLHFFAPTWTASIVKLWWPISGLIALGASLIGAIYPGLKAARQDAIEALAYD